MKIGIAYYLQSAVEQFRHFLPLVHIINHLLASSSPDRSRRTKVHRDCSGSLCKLGTGLNSLFNYFGPQSVGESPSFLDNLSGALQKSRSSKRIRLREVGERVGNVARRGEKKLLSLH